MIRESHLKAIDREVSGYDLTDARRDAGIKIGRPKATQRAKARGHKQAIRKAHPHLFELAFQGREWTIRRRARWQGSRPEMRIAKVKSAKAKRRDAKKDKRRQARQTDTFWTLIAVTQEGQHGDTRYLYRSPEGKLIQSDFERDDNGKRV